MASTIMNGVNAFSKNGGPTDSFRPAANSATSGHSVPTNTTNAATASSRLLSSSAPSRDTGENTVRVVIAPARAANSVSAPPTNTARIPRMNTPRVGSEAKLCTDVSTPERTMNVPVSDSPNAMIASRIVHAFIVSRFSTTTAECSSAPASSHGMKDAFSTGSQNQNPPQPSS